jgi:hypothetical protein
LNSEVNTAGPNEMPAAKSQCVICKIGQHATVHEAMLLLQVIGDIQLYLNACCVECSRACTKKFAEWLGI